MLRVRPRDEDASELHGLYTTGPRTRPLIRVWMLGFFKRESSLVRQLLPPRVATSS